MAAGAGFASPQLVDVTKQLQPGDNCLAVAVTNSGPNPAGLTGKLLVTFERGHPLVCLIDGSWKSAVKAEPNWNAAKLDDSRWPAAVQIAKMGDTPWNMLKAPTAKHLDACPLFRKEFTVHGDVRRATVYGSALGVYRLYINGKPVGDDYFTPDWTDYKKRVYYDTYDVTALVRSNGPNAIGGILGAGWYAGGVGWQQMRGHYGERPRLFAQLEIELADGTHPDHRHRRLVEEPLLGPIWKASSWPARPTTPAKRSPAGPRPG